LNERLLGSDQEGLGLGLGIIDRQSEPDRRSEANQFCRLLNSDRQSEPNTVLYFTGTNLIQV